MILGKVLISLMNNRLLQTRTTRTSGEVRAKDMISGLDAQHIPPYHGDEQVKTSMHHLYSLTWQRSRSSHLWYTLHRFSLENNVGLTFKWIYSLIAMSLLGSLL